MSHILAHTHRTPRWPPTPPDPADPPPSAAKQTSSVATALHVMSTERTALEHLEQLYQTDARAQLELARAVDQIVRSVSEGGKLVVCGVGKSGKIGQKIEATMNSLGIYSAFLHPTEALHGDLGLVRPNDTMLLISFSGRSPELLSLVPHIPPTVPVIALTSHTQPAECPLLYLHAHVGMGILLPAPIHEKEEISLGVGAPTSSTTVALCLGDALAIAVARRLHTAPGKSPADVFRSFHPGGAIGAAAAGGTPLSTPLSGIPVPAFDSPSSSISMTWEDLADAPTSPPFALQPPPEHRRIPLDMLVPFNDITRCPAASMDCGDITLHEISIACLTSPKSKSWFSPNIMEVIPPRRLGMFLRFQPDFSLTLREAMTRETPYKGPLAEPRDRWYQVLDTTSLAEIRQYVKAWQNSPNAVTVVAVMKEMNDFGSCIGLVEAEDILA